jgi:hypothetical protein
VAASALRWTLPSVVPEPACLMLAILVSLIYIGLIVPARQ